MKAREVRDEGVLLHQPDAPLIEPLDQRLQGRPRSIHQALFKWDPEMFCRHQFRGVGQREDQPDAWRNHHPGTAVPPCVINDQDQQTRSSAGSNRALKRLNAALNEAISTVSNRSRSVLPENGWTKP